MDIIEGAFTTRLVNITKAGEDIYVRGTNRLKHGAYKHGGMSSGVEGKMPVWCVALYNITQPMEYATNDAVVFRPL
jgi:hypothetical protein